MCVGCVWGKKAEGEWGQGGRAWKVMGKGEGINAKREGRSMHGWEWGRGKQSGGRGRHGEGSKESRES